MFTKQSACYTTHQTINNNQEKNKKKRKLNQKGEKKKEETQIKPFNGEDYEISRF